ncbi:MAG TPA: amidohydrolase [Holophagaceae bacterium]|nr:amidohydrolase [Holophagaceae bacterium]
MRTALVLGMLALPCLATPQDPVEALAASVEAKVLAWRRDIHQHPELGNREVRTSKLVADHLRSLGLEVRTGIARTGVVGILRGAKPGPRIALRADMDALPVKEQVDLPFASKITTEYNGEQVGVMHACGHDAHTAILMGVAQGLASRKATLHGEVMFIFQPAEEGAPVGETGGAEAMLAEGLFKDFRPLAVMGLHLTSGLHAGRIGYRSGPALAAVDDFRIVVTGRQTHGARPWGGVDPVVAAAELITSAQTIVSRRLNLTQQPAVLTFGAIKGGVRSNIIPDRVEMLGTLRTFDPAMRATAVAQLRLVAQHVAEAHGATAEVKLPYSNAYPVTVNDPALVERVLPSLRKAAGVANVLPQDVITGSEDFAFYAQQVPGFYFFLGVTPKAQDVATAASNHSPRFFVDESALPVGVHALLQASLDLLEPRR